MGFSAHPSYIPLIPIRHLPAVLPVRTVPYCPLGLLVRADLGLTPRSSKNNEPAQTLYTSLRVLISAFRITTPGAKSYSQNFFLVAQSWSLQTLSLALHSVIASLPHHRALSFERALV